MVGCWNTGHEVITRRLLFWDYKERGKWWHPCTWSEVRDEEYKITLRRATFYFKDFFTRQRHLQWPKAQPPAIEPFCSKLCMWWVSSSVFLLRALTKGIPHGLPEICLLLQPSTAVFMDPSCSHSSKWLPGSINQKNLCFQLYLPRSVFMHLLRWTGQFSAETQLFRAPCSAL